MAPKPFNRLSHQTRPDPSPKNVKTNFAIYPKSKQYGPVDVEDHFKLFVLHLSPPHTGLLINNVHH